MQPVFCLLKNVCKQNIVYWTGNICLIKKFSLGIMPRLFNLFLQKLKYMSRNQSQIADLYSISLAIDQKQKKKKRNVIFALSY